MSNSWNGLTKVKHLTRAVLLSMSNSWNGLTKVTHVTRAILLCPIHWTDWLGPHPFDENSSPMSIWLIGMTQDLNTRKVIKNFFLFYLDNTKRRTHNGGNLLVKQTNIGWWGTTFLVTIFTHCMRAVHQSMPISLNRVTSHNRLTLLYHQEWAQC